jgi:hypothetical protein
VGVLSVAVIVPCWRGRQSRGMTSIDLLADSFGRIHDLVGDVLVGLGPRELTYRIDDEANTIAWLVWHLTRIQDDHLADAAGAGQVWIDEGWSERFALPLDDSATGYGHTAQDVAAVVATAEMLVGYADAVHARTLAYVETLTEDDLARVVDERWNPPVTLAVRLVSVIGDALQHLGQAAYVRGVADRARA